MNEKTSTGATAVTDQVTEPQKGGDSPSMLSGWLRLFRTQPGEAMSPEALRMRRRFVWSCVVTYLTANLLMFLRFFFPRALFEPKTVFRIGYPSDFGFGVETKFQEDFRIWVVRNSERLFVIYARCTHLGCTPDWKESENKFKCPCHGSGYDSEGINFEGPAPRPMDRAKVELDAEGQIVVDTGVLYEWPAGATSEFDDPGAFLTV
ncbi:MAG: Rieske 2Fe-2S domain-containing protein [Acidobacteria bacterium]|nr:Rieske 2Fe-2S domain-containing protein [Acidobacteriota bacterium]